MTVSFVDSVIGTTVLGTVKSNAAGKLTRKATIPANAAFGSQTVKEEGMISKIMAAQVFALS